MSAQRNSVEDDICSDTPESEARFFNACNKFAENTGVGYRAWEVVKLLSGFTDGYRYTLEEVSHIFKLPPSYVLRIHKVAMAKLTRCNFVAFIRCHNKWNGHYDMLVDSFR